MRSRERYDLLGRGDPSQLLFNCVCLAKVSHGTCVRGTPVLPLTPLRFGDNNGVRYQGVCVAPGKRRPRRERTAGLRLLSFRLPTDPNVTDLPVNETTPQGSR